MVNIAFLIHFLIHSFAPPPTPPTHLVRLGHLRGSHKLRIPALSILPFIFLLPSMELPLALLSSLAGFLPLRIFDRLLSFSSLKFQHFLKILAPTPLLVLLLLLFSMRFFLPSPPLPHPNPYPHPTTTSSTHSSPKPDPQSGANARGLWAVYMKLGLDTKDVTGRLFQALPASTDSNLRSRKGLKAHPCLRL